MSIKELLSAADFFPEPMVLVSADGTIDTPNQSFADEFGLPAESLRGKRLDTLAALSAAAIQEFLRACAESKTVVKDSILLRRRAETVTLQARGVAYPPRSAPSASQVLLRLVAEAPVTVGLASGRAAQEGSSPSDWRKIEDSLRRQSQILEVTLASIGDAVIVTDVHGRVTYLNSVAETLTGWSSQEAKSHELTHIFRIINEHTRQVVEDPAAKVLRSGTTLGLANHTVLVARDGREIPISDSAAPIRLPNGELFGVVLVFRDVTEERRAEHARAWLGSIIESSDDAIVSKTLDGIITSWNPGAVRLFGYAPEEIIGKPVTTIIPPELRHEEVEVLARLRRGERVDHFETVRLAKSGKRIEISLTVSPVKDEHGQIVGASKIARDISEQKRSERLLREANQRKDEFLATLAHELRNPLASVRNASALLCGTKHERPDLQSACDILDRQLRQMTRLVDDLLDVSRINAGLIELQQEFLDVGQLVRTVESSLQPDFVAAHQVLTTSIPTEPLYVQGDRIRLTQVFSNVLHNANKYTPDGGRIVVEATREDADIVVRIRDTGIGIPSEMLDQVFELFSQVERSSHRARGGLGIGLTLSKRLVEIHGGRIQAHSQGPGRGTEFIIRLPASEPPATQFSAPSALESVLVSRRILIADDNEDAAVSLSMLLQSIGHETRVACDGVVALELAEEFRPEVVILDIRMPKLDGYEVARRISAREWARSTLLVALTGWGQEADRARAQEAGFHRHLIKPVELRVLEDVLAQGGNPT